MATSGGTVTCPDGHESEATDWCDTCGVAIDAAAAPPPVQAPASAPVAAAVPAGDCPNCGTEHHEGEAFCEVCGLDFSTGQLPEVAAAVPVEPDPDLDPAGATGAAGAAGAAGDPASSSAPALPEGPTWTVVIDADREWFDHNEAESGSVVEFPADAKPRTVALVGDVVTVGRRDDKRGWYPTIDLGVPVLDPSTSRKHAEIRPVGDGWQVVDLDSTNGTTVDGKKLVAGEPVDLVEGTVIHLGAFTRMTVQAPAGAGA